MDQDLRYEMIFPFVIEEGGRSPYHRAPHTHSYVMSTSLLQNWAFCWVTIDHSGQVMNLAPMLKLTRNLMRIEIT